MSKDSGVLRRWLGTLMRPSVRWSVLTLSLVGFIAGIVFWGGFNTAMEATNTLGFCTGCHEMRNTVFVEYQETIHFRNRSGVRATCSDCHVPKEWGPKLVRKIQATNELYGKLVGTIDTPQKFEAKRAELAAHVWKRMKETDSLECRNCHDAASMSADKQTEKAQARHAKARKEGLTCIDCHYGIAHKEPEGPGPQELFPKKP
jgi:cytochrome c-type protein NapC